MVCVVLLAAGLASCATPSVRRDCTSGGYRLLTEVEWEYVARAGAPRDFIWPWGNDPAKGCGEANGFDQTTLAAYAGMDTSGYRIFDPFACNDGWLNTAPVGSLAPNKFGVFDMIGNVAEWIDGCYTSTHDDIDEHGDCTRRLYKGGSWGTLAHNTRIAERITGKPTHRDDSIGIRVARRLR